MNRNRTTPTPATQPTTPAARAATAALVALAVATGVAAAPSSSAGDTQHASKPIPGYGSGVRVGLVTGLVSGV